MTDAVKELLLKKLAESKGWDKFEEDFLLYGIVVTDKEGNRIDPKSITSQEVKE